ncbi:MAG: type II secretion system protein [Candidatus Gracilibacteria bacterium]|nr:type II secretion system protein [Candidatus Gracilibacteria bacterium]
MVSQKIQATASKKGFTLVELIVVITILAILGTIGFISIQGYSAQSRDSKRTSDLRSLASALTIKATDGIALTSFVTANSGTTLIGAGSGISVAGKGLAYNSDDYTAGTPNFTALGVSSANFKDGNYDYRIGTSTRNGGVFQIAATLEAGGTKQALTSGNYVARTATTFTASGSSTTGTSATTYTVSNLTNAAVGYFNKNDVVYLVGPNGTGSISSPNGDGKGFAVTLTTASNVPVSSVILGASGGWSEASGLMASVTGSGAGLAVANGSTTLLPYSY